VVFYEYVEDSVKILFIVQRYGMEVDGGAELYCRWLAERCTRIHNVTVLTTTARDYTTWENAYSPGQTLLNSVTVIRMPVSMTRDLQSFNVLTESILSSGDTIAAQEEWLKKQGPWSPELLTYLEKNHHNYHLLVFVTYLYAPAVFGARIAPEKSILIPTAHNEPVAFLPVFRDLYARVAGLMYLTRQEQHFVESTYPVDTKPSILLGTGIDLPVSHRESSEILERYNVKKPFLFYMGRIEAGKGCDTLIRYFDTYRVRKTTSASLVLAGRRHMDIPGNPGVIHTGFIPDNAVTPFLSAADVVAVPSPFESLSILLLQAFASRRPVLVNADSPVLAAHCRESNGGLFYKTENEFIEALDLLLNHPGLRDQLGANGFAYVQRYFTWDNVLSRMDNFFMRILHSRQI
jgi:glycosyltransferase involved in cell wall biosynthesis